MVKSKNKILAPPSGYFFIRSEARRNPIQSLLEDQVSNLSLSVSLTQSSEETEIEAENDPQEKQVDSDDENAEEKPELSDEENLDEALMTILENFSDDDEG